MATIAAKRGAPAALVGKVSWPLAVGFAALAVPTLIRLATETWTHGDASQGPIVIATGAWLLWREWPALASDWSPGARGPALAVLVMGMFVYVIGRVIDYLTLECGGLYLVGLALLSASFGLRGLRIAWFPLVYLAFAIPLPGFLLAEITSPLKHFVAFVSTGALSAAGLPVARAGVTIMVAQYQLLVEDACSGMNSLAGLTAIGLLYIYLARRASLAYSLLLTCLVIPIAVASNIARVMALILITYFFGDAAGQSFIHMAAGLFLFATALLLVFTIDRLIYPLYSRAVGPRP